jgi:hypothetical protein
LSETRPSNFVIFALVVVALVLLRFAWTSTHRNRSADQQILIDRMHEQQKN